MRSDIASSTLVRLLGGWAAVDVGPSEVDFAERLGLWLNAFDAVGLQAAHQSIGAIKTVASPPAAARSPRAETLAQDFQRVRSALAHAIAQDPVPLATTGHTPADHRRLARGATGAADAAAASYALYHQRHLKLQREMALMIAPLRDHVRQALCRASPRLRQLAALDAVLEQALAAREQALLPTVPTLMERRFDHHRQAGKAAGDAAREPCSPGWLEDFQNDWRQVLLAELDLRLEPVAGLIDALGNETKHHE